MTSWVNCGRSVHNAALYLCLMRFRQVLAEQVSLFAFQKYNVIPDILLLAKALGGGMPLGAFISSNEIMSSLTVNPVLGHITTFGGHPVCCAAGLASLEVIINNNLSSRAEIKGELFRKYLVHPLIKEVRGEGLLLAVTIKQKEFLQRIISEAPDNGLLLDSFLFCEDAFRISPPSDNLRWRNPPCLSADRQSSDQGDR